MGKRSTNPAKEARSRQSELGRRDFGRLLAATLAGGALATSPVAASAGEFAAIPRLAFREQEPDQPPLSSAAQAEVEAKLRHIEEVFGSRLNDEQRKRLRGTVSYHVRMLEAIRPFKEANGDAPATVLKLIHQNSELRETMARVGARNSSSRSRSKGKI